MTRQLTVTLGSTPRPSRFWTHAWVSGSSAPELEQAAIEQVAALTLTAPSQLAITHPYEIQRASGRIDSAGESAARQHGHPLFAHIRVDASR